MHATFNTAHVKILLEASKASHNRIPSLEQIFKPEFWKETMTPHRKKLLLEEIETSNFPFSATLEDVDETKIPAGLWLVGDEGIYLMSNAPSEEVKLKTQKHVAYAKEANPEVMNREDCDHAKLAIFGGDDGCDFISIDLIEKVLNASGKNFVIDITPEAIGFITIHP